MTELSSTKKNPVPLHEYVGNLVRGTILGSGGIASAALAARLATEVKMPKEHHQDLLTTFAQKAGEFRDTSSGKTGSALGKRIHDSLTAGRDAIAAQIKAAGSGSDTKAAGYDPVQSGDIHG